MIIFIASTIETVQKVISFPYL
eukprot:COSAG06_NODE_57483_length_280_cov_0.618785_1_plen_21_part_10